MKAAYGPGIDPARLSPGLAVVANALNAGDVGRAKVAALRLRLPDLGWQRAVRIARVEDVLAKHNFNSNEPRDAQGRWTTGAGAASNGGTTSTGIASSPGAPVHLTGGRLFQVQNLTIPGIGDNLPPPEAEPVPEAEPNVDIPRVQVGWDSPAQIIDGLYYPSVRNPTLPDGTPWPQVTPGLVRAELPPKRGDPPTMTVFVPDDKIGPMLLGSTSTIDYAAPSGYSSVRFVGTPQVTYSRGVETGHADDSVREAIELAATGQFSNIYFNRSFTTITNRMFKSRIRPDVVAEARPGLDLEHIYHPYETLSPGQRHIDRERLMPMSPLIAPLNRNSYQKRAFRVSPYFIYIGAGH